MAVDLHPFSSLAAGGNLWVEISIVVINRSKMNSTAGRLRIRLSGQFMLEPASICHVNPQS